MSFDVSGSIRKVTLNGQTFDVFPDANFSEVGSEFENEMMATSGRSVRKMTKRPQIVEGVTLKCNGDEKVILQALADQIEAFPIAYETANQDVFQADGNIEFETRETENNQATIKLLARAGWTPFLQSGN